MSERFADIVLPLAQPAYTFAVDESLELGEGDAVAVQFGPRNIYTGIVLAVHDRRPQSGKIKTVSRKLFAGPLITPGQLALWRWMADYYMCTEGEIMRAALPSLMKPHAADSEQFDRRMYRPRTERFTALGEGFAAESAELSAELDRLERRAPKQYAAITELAGLATAAGAPADGFIPRRLLSADSAAINALVRKGLMRECVREVGGREPYDTEFVLPQLTQQQQQAFDSIREQWKSRGTVLLHGVTGSGKTEIYMRLIAETAARGGDVLMLVPEIALTSQLTERLQRVFGSRVTVWHSKITQQSRTETYMRLRDSQGGEIVVGARSALFLPLKSLQLVIVDEEHDRGYKQEEPAPRYNARDCAVMLARTAGARTLLGSATPSLESYMNARSGKYGLAQLAERYGQARLPEVVISDTLRAAKRGERRGHFNMELEKRMHQVLAEGGQVMLFQNRRGFAPYVECTSCGHTARCPECNVTLTLHKRTGRLECHYCGYGRPYPAVCPECGAAESVPMGFGTEKVEQQAAQLFPQARILRLDRDAATSEGACRRIVDDFAAGKADILVGTQMISKGFDFGRVALVGILNADNLLRNPDFRASERAFQTIMQVSGRAGRRDGSGQVVIQTAEPDHPMIAMAAHGDYEAMARHELAERETFLYPPYSHIIRLTLRHRERPVLYRRTEQLAEVLRKKFGRRLLGPVTPPVDRIRNEYIAQMMLKIENGASLSRARTILREALASPVGKELRNVTIVCDVDPQ